MSSLCHHSTGSHHVPSLTGCDFSIPFATNPECNFKRYFTSMPFSDATIISGHHCPLICVFSPYVYTFIAVTTIYNSFTCCLFIHLWSVFQAGGKKMNYVSLITYSHILAWCLKHNKCSRDTAWGWTDAEMDGWMQGCGDGWMDGCRHGWMDEWMDGWVNC